MKTIRPYIDSALNLWNNSSPAARISMCLLVGTCAIAVLAVGYWSLKPSYVVLLSEKESAHIDTVINALDKDGIAYKLSGAGNLLVDQKYYAKARLIARSNGAVPEEGQGSSSGLMDAFMSPDEKRDLALLQKQQRLADTIEKLKVFNRR